MSRRAAGLQSMDVDDGRKTFALPQAEKMRLTLAKLIKDGTLTLEPCNYFQNFDTLELLPHTSASASWITLGQITLPPSLTTTVPRTGADRVTMKLTFATRRPGDDNSLQIEREIYRYINSLVENGYTPHVILYVGDLRCDNFHQQIQTLLAARDPNMAELVYDMSTTFGNLAEFYDTNRMRAVITEQSRGITLRKVIEDYNSIRQKSYDQQKQDFFEVFLPIMFQVLYTLAVFEEVGLQHNDLHDENIFVDILDVDKMYEAKYNVDGMCFKLRTPFVVKLFDFDRATKRETRHDAKTLNNTLLNLFCENYGQCNTLDAKAEIFRLAHFMFVTNMTSILPNPYLNTFLSVIAPKRYLEVMAVPKRGYFSWTGSLCVCNQDGCNSCTMLDKSEIKSAREMLYVRVFEERFGNVQSCSAKYAWHLPSSSARR